MGAEVDALTLEVGETLSVEASAANLIIALAGALAQSRALLEPLQADLQQVLVEVERLRAGALALGAAITANRLDAVVLPTILPAGPI